MLLFWVGFSFVMAYIPFNLQRRFLVGIYIPITLAFWYLLRVFLNSRYSRRTKFIIILSICLVLPSNLLIFSGSVNAINNQDQFFFIDKGLVNSITWLTRNHSHGDVILADVENGLKIPALGPFKVVYGHPFESIDADQTEQSVNDFWSGKMSISESENFFSEYKVDLILCEYKNNVDECPITKDNHKIIYDVDKFAIFQVPN